jgi:hypothetical protein
MCPGPVRWIEISAELTLLDAFVEERHHESMPGRVKRLALKDLTNSWLLACITRQFIQHKKVGRLLSEIALYGDQKLV